MYLLRALRDSAFTFTTRWIPSHRDLQDATSHHSALDITMNNCADRLAVRGSTAALAFDKEDEFYQRWHSNLHVQAMYVHISLARFIRKQKRYNVLVRGGKRYIIFVRE